MNSSITANRLSGLDHLRALAIIFVFVYHYRIFGDPPNLNTIGSFGWTGVDLFFVLSGYLIGGQLMSRLSKHQPISYGEFYFKRSMRILPAYAAVLILYYTIPAFTERSTLPPLWKLLTFTQNFGLDLSKHAAFSHGWSLCIEEQFYLILPLIIIALTRFKSLKKGPYLITLFILAGFIIRAAVYQHYVAPAPDNKQWIDFYIYLYYPTYARLDGLLMGLILAALMHFRPATWQKLTRHGNLTLVTGLALIVGAGFLCADFDSLTTAVYGFPLISLAYGCMVLSALSPSSILYRHSSWLMRWIATLSYSIYLIHKQLIHLTHEFLTPRGIDNDTYTSFWICVIVTVAGAALLHFTIERPFLHLRDRLLTHRRDRILARRRDPGQPRQTVPPARRREH